MQTVIFICPQWSYRNISHFTYPIPIPLMVIYPLHCPLLKNKAWKTSLDKSEMWIASNIFSWSNPTTHWVAASSADVWFIRGNATVGGVSKYNQWIQPTFQWCRLSLADTAGWEWPLEMGVIDTWQLHYTALFTSLGNGCNILVICRSFWDTLHLWATQSWGSVWDR